ncbi:predicted transcriptional regulator [Solibacillus silvestris StLB046]|uniref:Predicted transcriptional regulator n=1 Tax=Solibacillus silvestris (strain StLB046) TaxID=1002809 RepID=F2F2H3_SOLSS|nr:helix-turn-helix transcriptional regulator [Solibacillus silvestris]BAK15811.1 predicted transcriptional regulator [Solibacillus silvestris StLB046]
MQWNLLRIRKENKLSQAKMAEILKIDYTTYHNKETGKSKFNADEMFLISNLFDLPIEDIFLPTDSNLIGVRRKGVGHG